MRYATLPLLLAALQHFQLAGGFSTPVAPTVGCGWQLAQARSKTAASFNVRQPALHLHGGRQSHSGRGLRMADGGEAAAAVPPAKLGFIEKVILFGVNYRLCHNIIMFRTNKEHSSSCQLSKIITTQQQQQQTIIPTTRSNPKSHQPPNAKNFFRSVPCSSSSSSTTPSYVIPKMC